MYHYLQIIKYINLLLQTNYTVHVSVVIDTLNCAGVSNSFVVTLQIPPSIHVPLPTNYKINQSLTTGIHHTLNASVRGMFEMNCLLSSSSISTWGTIKTNTYLYRAIQYLHNGV